MGKKDGMEALFCWKGNPPVWSVISLALQWR